MLLHGSLLLGSTQECILVWQGKNGKNGTQTGYCQCISLLYSKKPIIISNRERFPRLHRLDSVDVYLWRGVKGFAVMWFCLIFGFAEIFILFCGIAVLQDQAVCCIWEFWGNFSAVLFCAVFIPNSVGFAVFIPPLCPPLYGSR